MTSLHRDCDSLGGSSPRRRHRTGSSLPCGVAGGALATTCIILLAMAALTPAYAQPAAVPGATVCPPTSDGSADAGGSLVFVQQAQAVSATLAAHDPYAGSPPTEPGLTGYQALYGFDSPGSDLGKAICGVPVQKCASTCNRKQGTEGCAHALYRVGVPYHQQPAISVRSRLRWRISLRASGGSSGGLTARGAPEAPPEAHP
ncbi:hypothetical protein FOA52_012247 [Chlamydomonas sp. UWO 241]|nr:hypothetical protein FOA52_012247 [Chlamydomonas sp. UWO 241]